MSTEFDQYSNAYHRSIAHPVRSLLESVGENEFLRAKARWIDHWWTVTGRPSAARVLDYGCGTGLLTGYLHDLRPDWSYSGADPSAGMIDAARVRSALAPRGTLLIFEHNPFNPLTQIVVRSTPIDRDAQMRTASFVTSALQRFGFQVEARRYLHFFPPRLRALERLERGLAWLPLGSQYLVEARLSEEPVPQDVAR